jgi:hypothetical protein
MNINDFNSINPTLRGLWASYNLTHKSYHQPIFTSGSQCTPFTDATSAAPDNELVMCQLWPGGFSQPKPAMKSQAKPGFLHGFSKPVALASIFESHELWL